MKGFFISVALIFISATVREPGVVAIHDPNFAGHCTSAACKDGTKKKSREKAAEMKDRAGMRPIVLDTTRLTLVPSLIN
jgi:hypothetical protein